MPFITKVEAQLLSAPCPYARASIGGVASDSIEYHHITAFEPLRVEPTLEAKEWHFNVYHPLAGALNTQRAPNSKDIKFRCVSLDVENLMRLDADIVTCITRHEERFAMLGLDNSSNGGQLKSHTALHAAFVNNNTTPDSVAVYQRLRRHPANLALAILSVSNSAGLAVLRAEYKAVIVQVITLPNSNVGFISQTKEL